MKSCWMSFNRHGVLLEKIPLDALSRENAASQRDFVVGDLDARRSQVLAINAADGERDFGHAERLARIGAIEYNIGHLAAAEGLGRLFAQNPPDGVGDIGFAAAVWADDRRDAGLKIQRRFVRERFEPEHCQIL